MNYQDLQAPFIKKQKAKSHISAFVYGYSKFIENTCIAIILYFGTLILVNDDSLDGEKVFVAIFAIFW